MAEGVVYGGLPFPDTSFPVPDVYIYYVPDMINVWDTVSTFIKVLQLVLLTAFGAVDEPLASCMMVLFRVFFFFSKITVGM